VTHRSSLPVTEARSERPRVLPKAWPLCCSHGAAGRRCDARASGVSASPPRRLTCTPKDLSRNKHGPARIWLAGCARIVMQADGSGRPQVTQAGDEDRATPARRRFTLIALGGFVVVILLAGADYLFTERDVGVPQPADKQTTQSTSAPTPTPQA